MNVSSIRYLHYITTVKSQSDNLLKFKNNVLSKLIRDEESERVMDVLYFRGTQRGYSSKQINIALYNVF